ncbi:hypothetical protein N2603_39260 [Bradyrhizobium huanghuaihaiense]|uniref:hypothetical protein n=1 Tax=Bradyrhizobium huanghuaihaiense TaxID=990078 RepID=UPI0021AACE95|nr:hypothetical protein [Bradyrhizobium sp. CB3035]UWU75919.1 hypothetical protein N2603_39260 [Bradyrhizobium sp. CB3035]
MTSPAALVKDNNLENIRFRFDPQLHIRPISSQSRENAAGTPERYFFSAANGKLLPASTHVMVNEKTGTR